TLFAKLPPGFSYRQWIPEDKVEVSATVLIGVNLGYGLNHLLTHLPESHKVLVIEPDPTLLLACLGQTDYRPFLERRQLHFLPPDEDYLAAVVQNMDLQFLYGRIHVRTDMPSTQMGPAYARWTQRVRARMESYSVEMGTLRHRQDTMVGNELGNFRRALGEGSLKNLQGSGAGLSAVILGAGPSLADFAPALRADPGYALYATSLQTLPALQRLGITPHFCLALDFNAAMLRVYEHLDMERAKDVPLVYSTKVNPEVVARYPGRTVPLWTLGGLATFTMKDTDLVLDAGGNVSLTLVRLLRWCGVERMLLVGQDFAWREERTHAEGHMYGGARFVFRPSIHQRLRNPEGEEVITSNQYLASKRELETDLRKQPFPIFNLWGGGLGIEGAPSVTLDQARAEGLLGSAPGTVQAFVTRLEHCREFHKSFTFRPRSHIWTQDLKRAEKRLEKLAKRPDRHQEEIHSVLEQALIYIKQDPLYLPYLFNEVMNMAGLAKTRVDYGPGALAEYRRIRREVIRKVRQVDRTLTEAARATQAERAA
ncbi:MAG: motility associated factor glycosyltransferase family protein, partial [Desulfovibrionaceae bacterium]